MGHQSNGDIKSKKSLESKLISYIIPVLKLIWTPKLSMLIKVCQYKIFVVNVK